MRRAILIALCLAFAVPACHLPRMHCGV